MSLTGKATRGSSHRGLITGDRSSWEWSSWARARSTQAQDWAQPSFVWLDWQVSNEGAWNEQVPETAEECSAPSIHPCPDHEAHSSTSLQESLSILGKRSKEHRLPQLVLSKRNKETTITNSFFFLSHLAHQKLTLGGSQCHRKTAEVLSISLWEGVL